MPPSLDPALTELSLERLRQRRSIKWAHYPEDVLPAWVAEMDFPLAGPVRRALTEAVELGDCGYAWPQGLGLGEAFAGFARRRWGWDVDPGAVSPSSDVVGAIVALLEAIAEPGDAIVVNTPVYHPFFGVIEQLGCELAEAPLVDGRLDPEAIERRFAEGAAALILCSPHNPSGGVPSREELEAIAAAAERGIALCSASKAFNLAGLHCAQIVTASEPAAELVAGLPFGATHCAHLGAIAAVAAFREGEPWLQQAIAVLDHNRTLLAELLAAHLPEAGYEPPQAGYLAWLDLRPLDLGDDPAEPLLEHGRVALSPGPQFGPQGAGFARLNFGTSPALLEQIVARMAAAAHSDRQA